MSPVTSKNASNRNYTKTTRQSSVFEKLESRELMSASLSAVSWHSPTGPAAVAYEIGRDGEVFEITGGTHVTNLGGNVAQLSAGLDATGHPEVFGIAPDHTTWVNRGFGWTNLGGYCKQISASVNGTVYGIGNDNAVWVNRGTGWATLGGNASQISAGVDSAGKPECYAIAIGIANATYVNDGNGWVNLGGIVSQISGSINGTVFGLAPDHTVWVNRGGGYAPLGGQALQISAGLDATGFPEVFAIGTDDAVYVNDGSGWGKLGGQAILISAPAFNAGVLDNNVVFAVGPNNLGYVHNPAGGFLAFPPLLDAIQLKYQQLGGASGILGPAVTGEQNSPNGGGLFEMFKNGAIYYSASTGAHDLFGASKIEYLATANEKAVNGASVQSILGLPTTDEIAVAGMSGAMVTNFQGGEIYSSSATGAHVLYGQINAKYKSVGGPGVLGLPTNDESTTPDRVGRENHFQTLAGAVSAIDWTPQSGAHAVTGAIAARFASSGFEAIGEAVTDEIVISSANYEGIYSRFEYLSPNSNVPVASNAINWTPQGGATLVGAASYNDITQGNKPTGWIDASIAAVQNSIRDLTQTIQYQGNNMYAVSLYNYNNPTNPRASAMHPETQMVYFDGGTSGADLVFNGNKPSQSWTTIMQRAVLQVIHEIDPSQTVQNPHAGGCADALSILTGQDAQYTSATDQQGVLSALAAGKAVVFETKGTGTSTLVADQDFAVLSASSTGVTLYNPWGTGAPHPVLTLPWSVIAHDGNSFAIS